MKILTLNPETGKEKRMKKNVGKLRESSLHLGVNMDRLFSRTKWMKNHIFKAS